MMLLSTHRLICPMFSPLDAYAAARLLLMRRAVFAPRHAPQCCAMPCA